MHIQIPYCMSRMRLRKPRLVLNNYETSVIVIGCMHKSQIKYKMHSFSVILSGMSSLLTMALRDGLLQMEVFV